MKNYETVSEAVNDLVARGYVIDFNISPEGEKIVHHQQNISLSPEEFAIDEVHRFEGMTDPGDEMIVYAISSEAHNLKGILVNAFGPYADTETSKIVKYLSTHH